ncbi:glycosyltransferase family 1 protein [Novosphingobium sp.]|uniref:glycosyltransferase family 4 protein n=1 Tax=Novosphingobium sp. TaxID=1874826 RepID=UPI0025E2F0F1|nr:glycosyltransferase family 1 protein [Novosphingobium sp.]
MLAREDAGTGIQRVVRAMLSALVESPPDGFVVLPVVATPRLSYRLLPPGPPDAVPAGLWRMLPIAQVGPGDMFAGLDYSAHIIPARRRDLRRWRQRGARLAFVVYDLLPARNPEWFSSRAASNHARWLQFVARNADGLVCISQDVAADLAGVLAASGRADRPDIHTIRLGADIPASRPSRGLPVNAETLIERMGDHPAVLMVGTVEPRKGYDQALAAFEELWAQGNCTEHLPAASLPMLIIVGRPGWKTDALQDQLRNHPQSGLLLHWFDDASDEFLECLYRKAAGLLFASRGEGFGLPLIEAARHALPILARDLPVFREVAPPWTQFFASDDPGILAAAVSDWLGQLPRGAGSALAIGLSSWADSAADLRTALARIAM